MREVLIVLAIVVVGTKCIQMYNVWEEPLTSKILRESLAVSKSP